MCDARTQKSETSGHLTLAPTRGKIELNARGDSDGTRVRVGDIRVYAVRRIMRIEATENLEFRLRIDRE